MMHRFAIPGQDRATVGRKSVDRVCSRKPNQCVIFPTNVCMKASALERRHKSWFVRTNAANDLIIQVGEYSFNLHKLPMASRSRYLNRLVFERRTNGEKGTSLTIQIVDLPGGSEIFELVLKFCYGWKVDLTATNIAPLYCAAHFLEMNDDLEQGNLISKTETFLSFVIFSSWKDTFLILKSCELVTSWARDLQIVKRCSEAIAWKACIDPKVVSFGNDDTECLDILANNSYAKVDDDWWFRDVSFLRIDHLVSVIESIKTKGMKSELVGSCIAQWTSIWLSRIYFGPDNIFQKDPTHQVQTFTIECLVRLLPAEESSVSCNFLLHLLKVGLVSKMSYELIDNLERRIALMLEQCRVVDLLVKNYGDNVATYDVGVVIRAVEAYVFFLPMSRIMVVGRLVDGYLTLIARIVNLMPKSFQSLVEALPKNARYCHDNLYRAIDMYLKAHPNLTEEERTSMCRTMEYHKLSQEARKHAMRNDRLPLDIMTRFVLLEQVIMTKSMTSVGSNYKRTKSQAILRASKGLEEGWMKSQKEMKLMKQEVEMIKAQLSKLQICRIELQRQVERASIRRENMAL